MSLRRLGGLLAVALATLLWMSCGEVFRPVVIPTTLTPPNPASFHEVFGINGNAPYSQGTALQIDVSGDSEIGAANMGVNPTHAAILPNYSRVFVASAGSLYLGDSDLVTAFTPAVDSRTATGLGTLTLFTFPNVGAGQSSTILDISENFNNSGSNVVTVILSAALSNAAVGAVISISSVNVAGYNGSFLISSVNGTTITYQDSTTGLAASSGGIATVPVTCSYLPDYVATTQNTAVYVANYGVEGGPNCNLASTDSVGMLNPSVNSITNIGYLPPGSHPVAMAETPNALNLYVVNQGNNTVTDVSPIDLSTISTISVGSPPVWAVSRVDGNRVYVLEQGDGVLDPIDTATNSVLPSQTNLSVGAGASFILYDSNLNRLYVPFPGTAAQNFMDAAVYVFSTTGGVDLSGNPNDTPKLLATISMTKGTNPPCPNGCSPVSVAALPDGSRFYVASYQISPACPDPNVGASESCMIPMLTVFDALSMTVKPVSSSLLAPVPSLSLLTSPPFAPTQYALPPVSSCSTPTPYTPGATRFRMFTTAASDGSHVYVSICDAGSIADVSTTTDTISTGTNSPDTLITDLSTPFAACSGATCGKVATITGFSITSNVVTFQAANSFIAGQEVTIAGLTTTAGSQLDGLTLTVLATGLSGSQFASNLPTSQSNVPVTSDFGTAAATPVAYIAAFSITSNVVTFQAANTFVTGQRVVISGLSSTTGTLLDGQNLAVLASGLSSAQFECSFSNPNVPLTADSGTALPLPLLQSPLFLLTGQ
ncbi:MAG: YncE family protein [Candidatus Sulfotelmatobacter sp.]|jgi:streptogramin lyase